MVQRKLARRKIFRLKTGSWKRARSLGFLPLKPHHPKPQRRISMAARKATQKGRKGRSTRNMGRSRERSCLQIRLLLLVTRPTGRPTQPPGHPRMLSNLSTTFQKCASSTMPMHFQEPSSCLPKTYMPEAAMDSGTSMATLGS